MEVRGRGLRSYFYASDSRLSKVGWWDGSIVFIVCLVGYHTCRIGIGWEWMDYRTNEGALAEWIDWMVGG